ncbi:MAG: aspartate aminotransferase family protein, partial [Actinomycetes bacterium]
VRGLGLMSAIECVEPGGKTPSPAAAKAFMAECIKRNLIIMGTGGALGNGVRFLPPLNISDADMDVAFGIFTEAAKAAFA